MFYMKESLSESMFHTGQWNVWDDLAAYGYLSAPVLLPRGSSSQWHLTAPPARQQHPYRLVGGWWADTKIIRPGEERLLNERD